MVLLSFSIDKLLYRLLIGKKIHTIRIFNEKWKQADKSLKNGRKIDLNIFWKSRSSSGIRLFDLPLLKIEKFNINDLNEEIAINDGADSVSELTEFFKKNYDTTEFKEKNNVKDYKELEFCLIYWRAPKTTPQKPNKTTIDWFENLFTINPLVINKIHNSKNKESKINDNEIVNCWYLCEYCYQRVMQTRFNGQFHEGFYKDRLLGIKYAKENVFIESISDIFHPNIPSSLIKYTIETCNQNNENNAKLYYLTKNPERYNEFIKIFNPTNNYIGTTIETDSYEYQKRQIPITQATEPIKRYEKFLNIQYPKKFISLEPILEFSKTELIKMILDIKPEIVFIGSNTNNRYKYISPETKKIDELIDILTKNNIKIVRKSNLDMLYDNKIESCKSIKSITLDNFIPKKEDI